MTTEWIPETQIDSYVDSREDAALWRERVIEALRQAGKNGLTDWELTEHLHACKDTVASARASLKADGLVSDSGMRRVGEFNKRRTVWELKEPDDPVALALFNEAREYLRLFRRIVRKHNPAAPGLVAVLRNIASQYEGVA